MIVKVMMTLTLMFAFNTAADAQFGKLKNMAKKAVKEQLSVSLKLDTQQNGAITGDTRILHLENAQENAEISLTAFSQLMYLAAELIPALPDEYQTLVRNFLFQ